MAEGINYTALMVPALLLFMGIEYAYARHKKKSSYFKFESSISNLSIGVAERLMDLFFSASFYSIYYAVYKYYHVFDISNSWYWWIILLLATDLVWYWYHRLGHEINILWAAHIVHHQSEEFNYTVAARITIFQAVVRCGFWSILPLLGFPPGMVIPILLVHGGYSFFTHTRLVGKLGFIENILITPSHHRVHHAADEEYLDKNYGDIFIFWDVLFGTFKREEKEPTYGITHPLKSNSFIWQHFHYYAEIWAAVHKSKTWKEKFRAVFGGPEYMNPNIRPLLERKLLYKQPKVKPKNRFKAYLVYQITLTMAALLVMSLFYNSLDIPSIIATTLLILVTLVNCGALLEQRRWIFYLEITRFFIPIGYLCYIYSAPASFVTCLLFTLIIVAIFPLKKWYHSQLFQTAQ
ncbi:sterol desaturase [Pedobacter sp. HMF7647]|uniref:Sterol desaturase n=1 Tax=Hufsiella arboris TaxID=2695275 RepID=A0A7K1Y9S0_9SPHI|nr:sterol desaturase family protein [Hufsiella arboris]MXV51337.1 sterol desaturase [Hufsiella arboris]